MGAHCPNGARRAKNGALCLRHWTRYIEDTTSGLCLMALDGGFGHGQRGQIFLSIVGIALS
jgi:hypothetical protein